MKYNENFEIKFRRTHLHLCIIRKKSSPKIPSGHTDALSKTTKSPVDPTALGICVHKMILQINK